ncbi:MAG: hypothetical protein AMXMBFR26_04520 [Porticoccaceae bacterium]
MTMISAALGAGLFFFGCVVAAAPADHAGTPAARGDARQPLYLLPMMAEHQKQNMRDHLAAVNGIVAALAKGDFAAVNAAAKKLGTTPEMQQMCLNFGAATPGFSERALAFHATADTISAAADSADTQKVLGALNATLDRCVSCHAVYRQEVVDQERWRQINSVH